MPGHLYEDYTTHNLRDPEGLLSDIPALGTALLGVLAALWLRTQRDLKTKAMGLAAGAAMCLASGYFWSIWFSAQQEDVDQFVCADRSRLVADRVRSCLLAVEIKGWGKGKGWTAAAVWPWLVFGSNAIAAYMVSELLPGFQGLFPFTEDDQQITALGWRGMHIFGQIPNRDGPPHLLLLVHGRLLIPVWILYRKKIF